MGKPRKSETSSFIEYYLVLFNILSTIGWSYLLVLTVIHLLDLDGKTPISSPIVQGASATFSRFFSGIPGFDSLALEGYVVPIYRNSASTWNRIGPATAVVQSLAIMEVLNVWLGCVRSSLKTTAMQVASRLILVWGILDRFPGVRASSLFTLMILAWSITEVVRYSFYACSLLGWDPYALLFLRYTTFYVLYPLGASSEAFLIFATLPTIYPFFALRLWNIMDYMRALLFVIWWPGLYMMYTHMITQRRKVFGKGFNKRKIA